MRNKLSSLLILFVLLVREGLCAPQTDPPSGSVAAGFEGALNAVTVTCNVTDEFGNRAITSWSLGNFRGAPLRAYSLDLAPDLFLLGGDPIPSFPSATYDNRMTILNLTSELDRVVLFCGVGGLLQANVTLRIYRPPNLRDNFVVKIEENSINVPVDIRLDPEPLPLDTLSFTWTREGRPLTSGSGLTLAYSSVTFPTVARSDAGVYSVSASNHIIGDPTRQIGNDTGSFSLDVLYGPTFMELGPTQRYVLPGDPLSLVCGTGLASNPQASVTWMAPDGTVIIENARYSLENGPVIVRLNLTHTIMSDDGVWMCNVQVESERYIVSGGSLVRGDRAVIGSPIQQNIQLTLVVPPSEPRNLAVDTIEATNVIVCWDAPFNSSVSYYLINASSLNDNNDIGRDLVTNTSTNGTLFNVTGLLPGTTYELTVVAVSQGGDVVARSQPSEPVVRMTGVTVPAPTCNAPVSSNGVITVAWSYIHTGGLLLTNVSVVYRFEEGATMSPPIDVDIDNVDITSAMVSNLVAGRLYAFMITAENSIGSTSIDCGPVRHDVGIPAQPSFGTLTPGPDPGQVTVEIKTVASGLSDRDARGFEFGIVPVLESDGAPGNELRFPRPNYRSGTLERITISNLIPDQSYTFIATAVNFFGISSQANSAAVHALADQSSTQTAAQPENITAIIVGGVVGGIVALGFILIGFATFLMIPCLRRKGKGMISRSGHSTAEVVYDYPDRLHLQEYRSMNDKDIELKECPAYEKPGNEQSDIELVNCPAYVEKQRSEHQSPNRKNVLIVESLHYYD